MSHVQRGEVSKLPGSCFWSKSSQGPLGEKKTGQHLQVGGFNQFEKY